MRILIVHNGYRQPGGEDTVADAEALLLERHGHSIMRLGASNADISGAWSTLLTALRCTYSKPARERLAATIDDFRPNVVHVHNFFPLLSPSIYDACRDAGVPVVQTLHNYRLICPGALLLRNGGVCEKCVGGSAYASVPHGCYRDSPAATLATAHMVETHRRRNTWHDKVDRFIALTEFAKAKFVAGGLPASRIVVKPNSLACEPSGHRPSPNRTTALFLGRLSAEKGIATLASAWQGVRVPLRVAGTGPSAPDLANLQSQSVTLLGHLQPPAVAGEIDRASFLVLPSTWYEGFPMVLLEAFARARAVIASRIGALSELVCDGETGLLCEPGDASDLAAKVRWAAAHPQAMRAMGLRAREEYERNYTAEANYGNLMAVYRSVSR